MAAKVGRWVIGHAAVLVLVIKRMRWEINFTIARLGINATNAPCACRVKPAPLVLRALLHLPKRKTGK